MSCQLELRKSFGENKNINLGPFQGGGDQGKLGPVSLKTLFSFKFISFSKLIKIKSISKQEI